jgi:uncharacterized damage-inducible protein DinB
MKHVLPVVLSAGMLASVTTFAQTGAGQGRPPVSLLAGLQGDFKAVEQNLIEAAEKMPEANYDFKPSPEVRSFGQIFGHVANIQFNWCAAVKGEPNPNQGADLEKTTAKGEILKGLKDSFAYCDGAFSATTEANLTQIVRQGQNNLARAGLMSKIIAHNNEEYGTSCVYLRLKGLVPPSTARAQTRPSGQ